MNPFEKPSSSKDHSQNQREVRPGNGEKSLEKVSTEKTGEEIDRDEEKAQEFLEKIRHGEPDSQLLFEQLPPTLDGLDEEQIDATLSTLKQLAQKNTAELNDWNAFMLRQKDEEQAQQENGGLLKRLWTLLRGRKLKTGSDIRVERQKKIDDITKQVSHNKDSLK